MNAVLASINFSSSRRNRPAPTIALLASSATARTSDARLVTELVLPAKAAQTSAQLVHSDSYLIRPTENARKNKKNATSLAKDAREKPPMTAKNVCYRLSSKTRLLAPLATIV